MKQIITILAAFMLHHIALAQFPTNIIGSKNHPIALGTDANDNVYIAGSFHGTINFGTEDQPRTLSAPLPQTWAYIASYDSTGILRWGFSLNAGISEMIVDRSGNMYIFGGYSGTAVFDPGIGDNYLQTFGANYYIASYDANGDFRFVYEGGNIYDYNQVIGSIEISSSGDLFVFGQATGKTDIDLSKDTTTFNAHENGSLYVAQYSSSGKFKRAMRLVDLGGDRAVGSFDLTTVGQDNNIYLAGHSYTADDFDPSQDTVSLSNKRFDNYWYLASYTPGGELQFAHRMADSIKTFQSLIDMEVAPSGQIVLAGSFDGGSPIIFKEKSSPKVLNPPDNLSFYNGFLVSYNQDQAIEYALNVNTQIKKDIFDQSNLIIKDLELSANGDVYITGEFSGLMDLDPGTKQANVLSANEDGFLTSYDNVGNLRYAYAISAQSQWEHGQAMSLGSGDKLFLTGGFRSDSFDIDPGSNTYYLSARNPSTFIAVLDKQGELIKRNNNSDVLDFQNGASVNIYPNPAHDFLYINAGTQASNIQITDITGTAVQKIKAQQGNIKIDISELEAGTYVISMKKSDGLASQRFVKLR